MYKYNTLEGTASVTSHCKYTIMYFIFRECMQAFQISNKMSLNYGPIFIS